jgi:DNA-binding transcriptional MerR regulator
MFEQYSDEPAYNIKAVVRQTGISADILRIWERRYGVPSPPRAESGYRLYSERDLAVVRWLKAKTESGMSIGQAVRLLRSLSSQPADWLPAENIPSPSKYDHLRDAFIDAAAAFDEPRADRLLNEAFALFSTEDVCLNLIQPILVLLGEKWRLGEIDISTEHFATSLLRRRLSALMTAMPLASRPGRIVSACVPEEYHELGLLIVSLFLRRRGYEVIYLGQNIGLARLRETLEKVQPDVILLSASRLLAAANLLDLLAAIQPYPARHNVRIVFGGRIFNSLPVLRQRVPAVYVGEDAHAAVEQIARLLAEPPLLVSNSAPQATNGHAEFSDLHSHAPRVIADAASRLQPPARAQLVEACERMFRCVEAAARFGAPDALAELSNWAWDADPPDGLSVEQLQQVAAALDQAAESALSPAHYAALRPYLQALRQSCAES